MCYRLLLKGTDMKKHYIINYYLVIDDVWTRMVHVCDDMQYLIGFLDGIDSQEDEHLISVEVC